MMFPQKYIIIAVVLIALLAIFNLHKKYKLVPRNPSILKKKAKVVTTPPTEDDSEDTTPSTETDK
jgi:hypothetical protein